MMEKHQSHLKRFGAFDCLFQTALEQLSLCAHYFVKRKRFFSYLGFAQNEINNVAFYGQRSRALQAGRLCIVPVDNFLRIFVAFSEVGNNGFALGLILAKLVEENKLEPTEDQIKAVVANFAESYEDPQEVIDWYYAEPSRLQGPTSLAVESNVVDFVLSKAKVTEKALSFDEVMGAQA